MPHNLIKVGPKINYQETIVMIDDVNMEAK